MKNLLGMPLLAVALLTVAAQSADAAYCGAARYRCCAPSCGSADYCGVKQQCHTVMKTCKEVVYEKKQYTCYRNVYKPVYETKHISNKTADIVTQ